MVETSQGYRRIVAAPKPMNIVEIDAIRTLSDADQVVIACGGGGIPVLTQNNNLKGASAVIEKDLAAGKLAQMLNADMFVILTGEEKVCLNYKKPDQKALNVLTVSEAGAYIEEGQFEEGTILPKIQAAVEFIGDSAVKTAIITKLDKSKEALEGTTGTVIRK